jgi:hypothetical protein
MTALTGSQWTAVWATLPTGTNEAWFRSELERIASDTVPPRKQQQAHLNRAQVCRDFIHELRYLAQIKDKDALAKQLQRQEQEEESLADKYRRIAAQKRPKRFLQYCFLLDLWVRAGGHLRIRTPYKRRDARHNPLPTGPVIPYLQAVATAIWGKTPGADQIKKIKRQYLRTFKGRGSSDIASTSYVTVEPILIKRASVRSASTSYVTVKPILLKRASVAARRR